MPYSNTQITISFSRGWIVTAASAGLGLVLGILYVWSVIKTGIPVDWGWSHAEKAMPYSVMAIAFSFIMVPAGKLQDHYGPRPIISLGGFLAGSGCIISGLGGNSLTAFVIGFGIITGAGVGCAYSALTPATIKWFPPEKTGLTAGIVVAGSALAPLPLAPLTAWLLKYFSVTSPSGLVEMGVGNTMIALGLIIWLTVLCLVWFVYNPPIGFTATPRYYEDSALKYQHDFTWQQMLRTRQFWLMYFMYFSGASAGLVFIGVAADFGRSSLGELAFLAVVTISLGNTLGRILAGITSDRIGRQTTLLIHFILQALIVGLLYALMEGNGTSWMVVLIVMFMIGLNYGANLCIFPASCKDYFGIKNFGLNYGCLFTAFGTAGLIMPWFNGLILDLTGKADISYFFMMSLLFLSAIAALLSRRMGAPTFTAQPNGE